jgi:hypothetical protein
MGYTAFWIAWLAAFALVEGKALLSRTPDSTFSEHVWDWFRVRDSRPTGWVLVARSVLLLFLVWLAGHLAFGWWTPTNPHPWPW